MSEEIETVAEPAPRPRATFASLTAEKVADTVVEVELSDGTTALVRGMTRMEIHLGGKGTEDHAVIEARNLSYGLIDPKLSYEQARAWMSQVSAGGDLAKITRTIRDLSGLGPGADKS